MEEDIQKMDEKEKRKLIETLIFYRNDIDLMDEINSFTFIYTSKYKKFINKNNQ